MNLTLSLAQMCIQFGQPQQNLALTRSILAEAARRGSQLVLFPELWTTGYDLSNARALAQDNARLLPELARLAREHALFTGGSLLLERDGKIYNSFVFQSPADAPPIIYSKIHLFRLMEEERWLTPGDHLQEVQPPWGKAGLAICYDLRFPEMFRRYALSGAGLILISAEWPVPRIGHWQTLLRARAIENQCFVAATNCAGPCGAETFGGRSAVISPWGETLVEASTDQAELLTLTIDLDRVAEARQRIPILQDRRPDLYG
jgi:predicted amidohydrolase